MRLGRIFLLGFIDDGATARQFGLEWRDGGYGYVRMLADTGTRFTLVGERTYVEMLSSVTDSQDDEGGDESP